jgi:hypothetical protein
MNFKCQLEVKYRLTGSSMHTVGSLNAAMRIYHVGAYRQPFGKIYPTANTDWSEVRAERSPRQSRAHTAIEASRDPPWTGGSSVTTASS